MSETPTPARAADAREITDELVKRGARALLALRGYRYAYAPEEYGQDAYTVTLGAREEARACLTAALPTPARAAEITEEMVERGARAICEEWGYLWEDGDPTSTDPRAIPEDVTDPADDRPDRRLFRRVARACLTAALSAPTPAASGCSAALADVAAERRRQVDVEGWTPEHDDAHSDGALARAAGCYALHAGRESDRWRGYLVWWPWSTKWWRPTSRRRDLVKAGALILAEIERLDRAATPSTPPAPEAR